MKTKKTTKTNFIPRQGLSVQLCQEFMNLACRLSPEDLYEDGEISEAQAEKKLKQINKEWSALEKKAGRVVNKSEFPY